MADLIDRQATLKHIEKIRQDALMMDDLHRASIIMNGMYLCEEVVRDQPSAQPLTAYVISDEDGNIKCSNCGSFECWGNYCMNCGAKMRGEKDG